MKAFKYIRIALASMMLLGITALLLDTTGLLRHWLGWMPKVQLLPAVMALNLGIIVAVAAVTLLIGRLYCSLACPMGIFQDIFVWAHKLIFPKRKFRYRKPANWLRYVVLACFVLLIVLGLNGVASLIAPYSAYARMVTSLHASGLVQWIAIATLAVIGIMSFLYGRLWCNTICPVGTTLGLVSRFRLFGIKINRDKCVACRRCEQGCKAMCIDINTKTVDHSRCVDCWNCLAQCRIGAIGIAPLHTRKATPDTAPVDHSRRKFVAATAAVGAAMTLEAQEQKLDGGLASIMDKQVPDRRNPLQPAGSQSKKHFESHCTACQLCVGQCPEHVLRPSTHIDRLLQPEMTFSQGYCRPACTRCSKVCPTGAILPIAKEEKTAISVGHAVTLTANCLSATGSDQCGACARHCPAAAISMITNEQGHPTPVVNEARCIGCGACEYYCPARPMTAIYVEGRETHTEI